VDNISRSLKNGSRLTWGFINLAALVIIIRILIILKAKSNWEAEKGASISSPYQVINGENTNDAESLSSPLVNLQHYSAVQTWGVSILYSGGEDCAFSMAGIEKEERGVNPLANENHPSLFWHDQDCGRWKLECIRYLMRIRCLTHGCPYSLPRHWCEIKGFSQHFFPRSCVAET
jgi:hypothetical protein